MYRTTIQGRQGDKLFKLKLQNKQTKFQNLLFKVLINKKKKTLFTNKPLQHVEYFKGELTEGAFLKPFTA